MKEQERDYLYFISLSKGQSRCLAVGWPSVNVDQTVEQMKDYEVTGHHELLNLAGDLGM